MTRRVRNLTGGGSASAAASRYCVAKLASDQVGVDDAGLITFDTIVRNRTTGGGAISLSSGVFSIPAGTWRMECGIFAQLTGSGGITTGWYLEPSGANTAVGQQGSFSVPQAGSDNDSGGLGGNAIHTITLLAAANFGVRVVAISSSFTATINADISKVWIEELSAYD